MALDESQIHFNHLEGGVVERGALCLMLLLLHGTFLARLGLSL
jgi:hypothetical protein